MINLFPIALPMTSLSSVHGHDGSADIVSPPGAVYTNSNGFDGEKKCLVGNVVSAMLLFLMLFFFFPLQCDCL